ncbi:response regulator [Paenibacillus aquistagni]|uniref:Two component transcriptional regulator, AraC family n=1 Tax=Paenibacillus aquistagni TaxID=1852522 RepID=A0A1X7LPT4_9BACL|nr:response regulator [Paenibacillus aquistagni]SMG55700.1 two component transcriptional regulator, AraC family [Paenibacillus aquistagni]
MKIKVLLVDDEPWVVESLKASIDWATHDFEVIGTACSGTEALTLMETLQPDVVFTDIRMPGMSGLELIKRGKERSLLVDYVVVSGYAEFAYAQKALAYGAMSYCLKPFDEGEIESILGRIKIKRAPASLAATDIETKLLAYMEDPSDELKHGLFQQLQELSVIKQESDAIGILVLSTSGTARPSLPEAYPYAKIGRMKHLFLLPLADLEPMLHQLDPDRGPLLHSLMAQENQQIYGIGVSERSTARLDLRRAIKEANELADQHFIRGGCMIARREPSLTDTFKGLLKQMDEVMRAGDMAGVHRSFDELSQLFAGGALTAQHALQLYHVVNAFLYCFRSDHEEQLLVNREQLLMTYPSVTDMLQDLRQRVARSILEAQDHDVIHTSNETFRTILIYVNQHFTEDISIQSLSQQFYTNPSYISQLFKKELGETFTAYTARLRMTYACELLGSTDLMVGEIAERSGYMDYFYFTKMFKKLMGKTPSQFRTEMR